MSTTTPEFYYNAISYYPTYNILDNLIGSETRADIFVDVRGCASALYYEDFVRYIVTKYNVHKIMDYTILSSLLNYIAWHKKYARIKKKDIHLHFFLESGSSVYHKSIHKGYKDSRAQSSIVLTPLEAECFQDIFKRNIEVFKKTTMLVPTLHTYHLMHFEADFVPHWAILKLEESGIKSSRIIYSKDKDMAQLLQLPNTKIFTRKNKAIMLGTTKENYMDSIFKVKGLTSEENIKLLPYVSIMNAVVGDDGDDVTGLKGIGYSTFISTLKKHDMIKDKTTEVLPQEFFDDLSTIDEKEVKKSTKIQNILKEESKVIIDRNYKLVSYHEIAKHIPLTILETLINNFSSDKETVKPTVLTEAFRNAGIIFDANELY